MVRNNLEVVEQLSKDTFVVKLTQPTDVDRKCVSMVHDYIQLQGRGDIKLSKELKSITVNGKEDNHSLSINQAIQIPIRLWNKFLLPYMSSHQHSTLEHIKDNYSYTGTAIQFYEDGNVKVAYLRPGMLEPVITTLEDYQVNIFPKLYKPINKDE